MENPKICECPFTDWCHEPRQWLQVLFRKESKLKRYQSIEQCDFYKLIKEKENEK
jgi:hypothetical protein